MEAETMLAEIKRAREAALTVESETKAARHRAEALNADLQYRLAKVEEVRREVLAEARTQAQAELEALQHEAGRLRDQLDGLPAQRGAIQSGGRKLHEQWLAEAEIVVARRSAAAQPLPSMHVPEPVRIDGPLLPSDTVWVPSLGASGEVVGVSGSEVEVKVGGFRLPARPGRVELRTGPQPAVQVQSSSTRPNHPAQAWSFTRAVSTVDDMLIELDRYLDTAYLAGSPFVPRHRR